MSTFRPCWIGGRPLKRASSPATGCWKSPGEGYSAVPRMGCLRGSVRGRRTEDRARTADHPCIRRSVRFSDLAGQLMAWHRVVVLRRLRPRAVISIAGRSPFAELLLVHGANWASGNIPLSVLSRLGNSAIQSATSEGICPGQQCAAQSTDLMLATRKGGTGLACPGRDRRAVPGLPPQVCAGGASQYEPEGTGRHLARTR
jgi:hypothetical protein